jgi:hypothetical protein
MQGINTENTEATEGTESALALRCVDAGESAVALRAREFASELRANGSSPDGSQVLMYAPAGVHTITPAAGNGSIEITVAVDQNTAAVLNASLAAMNARLFPQRCFIDKEHERKEAAAWPENFFWSETAPDGSHAPGVYLKCQMTALGRQLIDGKIFRAFSPSITTDVGLKNKDIARGQHLIIKAGKRGSKENPARLNGVVPPDIGTLTNLPAFKEILPLFAKDARGGQSNQPAAGAVLPGLGRETGNANMKKTDQELLTLRARKSELENQIPTLRAKDLTDAENVNAVNSAQGELDSIDAELRAHEMATENETLRTELRTNREKESDLAVKAAVKRGAIPAKNLELQASWKRKLVEDPTNSALLDAIPSAPALQQSNQRVILQGPNGGSMEMRASNRDVLRAYCQHVNQKDHNAAAALYATEIVKRVLEGDDIALRAADVTDADLGTLAGTIVAQRALDLFTLEFGGLFSLITTDFSDQPGEFNGTTISRIIVIPAVETYHTVNGWVQGTAAKTVDVPVTLDQHKGVPINFNSNILASTVRRLMDEQAPAASYALTKNMVDHLYGKILIGTFTDPAPFAEAEVDFGRRTFGKVGRRFNPDGVPMTDRFALLNSDYHDALEQDPTITNLAVQQSSREEIITEARMPKIKNFRPIEAPNLPTTANMAAFFGHKSSLIVKSRVPNDYTSVLPGGASHGLVRLVKNQATGFTCMVVFYADHQKGFASFRIAGMWGSAAGNKEGGQIVTSQ